MSVNGCSGLTKNFKMNPNCQFKKVENAKMRLKGQFPKYIQYLLLLEFALG